MNEKTGRQDFIHVYGKSVYEVRLEIAEQLYARGDITPLEAFRRADDFLVYLKNEDSAEIEKRFQ